MVEAYLTQQPLGTFSFRILLPRDPKSTKKAKTIGLAFQGEFLLGLRKRKVVPNVARYVISMMSIIMDGYLQILRYMSDLKTGALK